MSTAGAALIASRGLNTQSNILDKTSETHIQATDIGFLSVLESMLNPVSQSVLLSQGTQLPLAAGQLQLLQPLQSLQSSHKTEKVAGQTTAKQFSACQDGLGSSGILAGVTNSKKMFLTMTGASLKMKAVPEQSLQRTSQLEESLLHPVATGSNLEIPPRPTNPVTGMEPTSIRAVFPMDMHDAKGQVQSVTVQTSRLKRSEGLPVLNQQEFRLPFIQQTGLDASVKNVVSGLGVDENKVSLQTEADKSNHPTQMGMDSQAVPVIPASLPHLMSSLQVVGDSRASNAPQVLDLNHSAWANELGRIVGNATVQNNGSMQVKVHPEGMGDLLISVSHTSTGVQIQMESNQLATVQWLGQQTQQMSSAVSQLGITVAGVEVSFGQANLGNPSNGQQNKKSNSDLQQVRFDPKELSSSGLANAQMTLSDADIALRLGSSVSYRI